MKYDEQFLLKAAIRLEAEARNIVISTAGRYALVTTLPAYVGGVALRAFMPRQISDAPIGGIAIVLGLVAMIFGIVSGREKAFALRVQMNQLLALVQIEHNTHRPKLET